MTGVERRAHPDPSHEDEEELPEFLLDLGPERVVRAAPRTEAVDVPGEPGLWIFILGDMSLFAAFFLALGWEEHRDRAATAAAARQLLLAAGAANTLVLLTSSLLVVIALRAFRSGAVRAVDRAVVAAVLCAGVFVCVKSMEYVHVAGVVANAPGTVFWTYYLVLTGIHLVHVLVGAVLLLVLRAKARSGTMWPVGQRFAEGATVYWHMVDLLWVVLFSLLYVAAAA